MEMLDAKTEEAVETEEGYLRDAEPNELIDYAFKLATKANDDFGTAFAYKLLADVCLYLRENYHEDAYKHFWDEKDPDTALLWARDAGWLQNMQHTLHSIQCGPQDFKTPAQGCDSDD